MSRTREFSELATAYDSGGGFGFRNRLINSDMRIDQRNAGAAVSKPAGSYVLDRWFCNIQTPTTATVSRSTTAPAGFTNSLLVNVTTGSAISTINYIAQFIEGFNTADLGFGSATASTVTISFWVRSSVTGTFGGSLRNYAVSPATTSRAYPFTYAINAANTWEYKTVTIAGDGTGGAGQWNTENQGSFSVFFDLGSNSLTGTAGAWAGSNLIGATGTQTGLMTTNGATWYVTGVQLEAGSVATPFERRPYGAELSLCQRYAWKYGGYVSDQYGAGIGYYSDANQIVFGEILHPQLMRTTPNMTVFGTLQIKINGGAQTGFTPVINAPSPHNTFINMQKTSHGLTVSIVTNLNFSTTSDYVIFSAEL